MRFSWIFGVGCKAASDGFAVLTLFHQIDYFGAAPLILIAGIAFTIWASSCWMHAILISVLLSVNAFFCFSIGEVVGFWSNPWLVVGGWLWILTTIICLVSRISRWLFSHRRQKNKAENRDTAVMLKKDSFSDKHCSGTSVKRIIPFLAITILGLLVLVVSFDVLIESRLQNKYTECDPKEMVAHLEKIFEVHFPEEIKESKAARTRGSWWEEDVTFMVKFAAEPNFVDRFLESFPEKIHFQPYQYKEDLRGFTDIPSSQSWFTNPIQQGKSSMGGLGESIKNIHWIYHIYIDTTDERNFVVYIEGIYSRKLEN
jgi:hypothetical protein